MLDRSDEERRQGRIARRPDLIVSDIEAAREHLEGRGVGASEIFHFDAGGQLPGPDPERTDYGSFICFDDPDGNGWLVQEVGRSGSAA